MPEITPILSRRKHIGWTVDVDGESVRVLVSDLPAPDYPTIHQIRHTARAKLLGEPADKVALALAIDECHALALAEWDRIEATRRECCRLANMDWRKCAKVENEYRDHSTLIGFDTATKSAAYECPELGWNPDDDNGAEMWAIISAKPAPKPKLCDQAIRQMAIAMLTITREPVELTPF